MWIPSLLHEFIWNIFKPLVIYVQLSTLLTPWIYLCRGVTVGSFGGWYSGRNSAYRNVGSPVKSSPIIMVKRINEKWIDNGQWILIILRKYQLFQDKRDQRIFNPDHNTKIDGLSNCNAQNEISRWRTTRGIRRECGKLPIAAIIYKFSTKYLNFGLRNERQKLTMMKRKFIKNLKIQGKITQEISKRRKIYINFNMFFQSPETIKIKLSINLSHTLLNIIKGTKTICEVWPCE